MIRAIRREGALPVWRAHVTQLLQDTPCHARPRAVLERLVADVDRLAQSAAEKGQDAIARQAATALYRLTAAIAMGWEAGRTGSVRRMLLAQLTVRHALMPRDPLRREDDVDLAPLFADAFERGDVAAVNALGAAG